MPVPMCCVSCGRKFFQDEEPQRADRMIGGYAPGTCDECLSIPAAERNKVMEIRCKIMAGKPIPKRLLKVFGEYAGKFWSLDSRHGATKLHGKS